MEKIIFLDVDGVLNFWDCWLGSTPNVLRGKSKTLVLSIDAINQLNRIIKETGAKIVISSTWRKFKDHYNFLLESPIEGEIIGETPDLLYDCSRKTSRGLEIKEWLENEYGEKCKFVILDDDDDMGDLKDYLIQTNFEEGLTKEIADTCIKRLNEKGYYTPVINSSN